jgi:hypothetical protein
MVLPRIKLSILRWCDKWMFRLSGQGSTPLRAG